MTDVIPTPTGQVTDLDQLRSDLVRARQETAGPVPLIQSSVDPFIDLPRGLNYNGSWQKRVTVRELTGVDEEALARVKTVPDLYDTVLALGVLRIGEIEMVSLPLQERQGYLQQLLVGERDQVYIAVVRATYGDTKTLRYTCTNCNEEQDLILTLSEDFKPKEVENPEQTEFSYVTSKGEALAYRLVTGADQTEALGKKGSSMAEQNTVLLSRCIKTVNGQLIVNPIEYARSLGMRDRQALLGELMAHQPSVDLTVTVNCVACREEQVISLGWGDIFRP